MEMQPPHERQLVILTTNHLRELEHEMAPLKRDYDLAQEPRPNHIEDPYHAKLREIEAEINHNMDLADQNCATHEAYIQQLLNIAKSNVALLKKYTDAYNSQASLELAEKLVHSSQEAVTAMANLNHDAKAADLAYGKAWFPYRENPVDGKYNDDVNKDYFSKKRMDIMGRNKVILAKIAKCEQLEAQAKAYQTMSLKLLKDSQGQKTKKSEVKQTVADLSVKLNAMFDQGIKNAPKLGWGEDGHTWTGRLDSLKLMAHGNITHKTQDEAKSRFKDIEAAAKNFRNQLKTMETLLATTKRSLTADELNKNIKLLALADGVVVKARQVVAKADAIRKDCETQLNTILHAHV